MRAPEESQPPITIGLRERQVELAIMVPESVKGAVRRAARLEGLTTRGLLLRLIKQAGIAEIGESETADQRAVVASAKAQLFREAQRR